MSNSNDAETTITINRDSFNIPKTKPFETRDEVVDELAKPNKSGIKRLNPVLNMIDKKVYMSVYMGMGNAEHFSLDMYPDVVRNTIEELYVMGELVKYGEAYTYGPPGSPLFVMLKLDPSIPF